MRKHGPRKPTHTWAKAEFGRKKKKKKKKSYPGEEWTEKGQMLREQKEFKKYFERMDFFVQGPSMGESMMMMINAIIR